MTSSTTSADKPRKTAWDSTPQVGEYLTDNDPKIRLIRKIRVTKWMAILETVSYCALLVPMYRKHILNDDGNMNYSVLRIIAYFHGIIAAAFEMVMGVLRGDPAGAPWCTDCPHQVATPTGTRRRHQRRHVLLTLNAAAPTAIPIAGRFEVVPPSCHRGLRSW
jgi:hypothetical protein